MVPFCPVHREQHPAVVAARQDIKPLGREVLVVDVGIAQQPVEAIDRTVQAGPQPRGQRGCDGEGPCLTGGRDRSDDQAKRRATCLVKGLEQGLEEG